MHTLPYTIASTLLSPSDLTEQIEHLKDELALAKTNAWRTVLTELVTANKGKTTGLNFADLQERVAYLVENDFDEAECWNPERRYEFTFTLNVHISGSKMGLSQQDVLEFINDNVPTLKLSHVPKEYGNVYMDDLELDENTVAVQLS